MKREVIRTPGAPAPMAHYCQGVVVGNTIFAAGQIASDYKTGVAPEAQQDPAFPYYGSNIQKQARYILQNLRGVFEAAGCGLQDVVKSQVFMTDLNDFYYFDQVWKEFFPSPPPRTTVQVSALLVPGCRVEIDLTGVKPGVERRVIRGASTPTPMAHYGQGVVVDDTLYAAGQIASDYRTGVPPEARRDPAFPYYGSDIERQTRYVLSNIRSVYEAAGCEFADTVKAQVFLTDLDDFPHFDRAWREFFPSPPPRTTIQIGALLVPGCRIEIDLTAVHPRVPRKVIAAKDAPAPTTHDCQAVLVGDMLYAAGRLASNETTGVADEARQDTAFPYYGSDIQKQTRYILGNLRSIFEAAGCSLDDVVKSQVFLTDLADFYYFDQVWKEFFPSPPPRTTLQVSGLLVPGCGVEVDLVGCRR
ncbi:MAG TPA: RidA family protein [Casimicrobiaceae bacterium]|nr:RidA family protein [Casimicrobiaceae bacterium]